MASPALGPRALMLAGEGERDDRCINHNGCLTVFVRENPRAEAVHCPPRCTHRSDSRRERDTHRGSALGDAQLFGETL